MSTVAYPLPDGSTVEVDRRDTNRSLISRYVDGECVWGQSFSCSPREDHDAQVAEIIADMASRPSDFSRWWNTTDGSASTTVNRPTAVDRDPAGAPASRPGHIHLTPTNNSTSPTTRAGRGVSHPGESATHPSSTCAGNGSERGTPRMGSTTTPTTRNATAPPGTGPVA